MQQLGGRGGVLGVCHCVNYSPQRSFILRVILQQSKTATMRSKPLPALRKVSSLPRGRGC